jgi:hypothetical protein
MPHRQAWWGIALQSVCNVIAKLPCNERIDNLRALRAFLFGSIFRNLYIKNTGRTEHESEFF